MQESVDAAVLPESHTPFPPGGVAVVAGAGGGIGSALADLLEAQGAFARVGRLSRPDFDLLDEASIIRCMGAIHGEVRLVLDATGFLHDERFRPERSLAELDAEHLARAFAINASGPALLMKHALPLLAGEGKAVFASLSARVGSIGDNRLGGWYAYRASKAALNQLLRTAAVETARRRKETIIAALHPGTVETKLSAPFARSGLKVRPAAEAARDLWEVLLRLRPVHSGGFWDWQGEAVPW
jgi:NAD(P)-dependent dehydrogenase (short-subunit alcohol dehydrogenase family)